MHSAFLNAKNKCAHKEEVLSDEETLHAFEHLSLMDLDDETRDKKENKNAANLCDNKLEA